MLSRQTRNANHFIYCFCDVTFCWFTKRARRGPRRTGRALDFGARRRHGGAYKNKLSRQRRRPEWRRAPADDLSAKCADVRVSTSAGIEAWSARDPTPGLCLQQSPSSTPNPQSPISNLQHQRSPESLPPTITFAVLSVAEPACPQPTLPTGLSHTEEKTVKQRKKYPKRSQKNTLALPRTRFR